MASFKEYTDALGAAVANMATDVGIGSNADAQKLVKTYKDSLVKEGATPIAFDKWLAGAGHAELLKIEESKREAAQKSALTYMANQEKVNPILAEVFKTGKYAASGAGDWLGKNWPMLAAITAPLMLGIFFELGAIVPLLLGVAGLGAAAYFSEDGSLLKDGLKFMELVPKEPVKPKETPNAPETPSKGKATAEKTDDEKREKTKNPGAGKVIAPESGADLQKAFERVKETEAMTQAEQAVLSGTFNMEFEEGERGQRLIRVLSRGGEPVLMRVFVGKLEGNDLTLDRVLITGLPGQYDQARDFGPVVFKNVVDDYSSELDASKLLDTPGENKEKQSVTFTDLVKNSSPNNLDKASTLEDIGQLPSPSKPVPLPNDVPEPGL